MAFRLRWLAGALLAACVFASAAPAEADDHATAEDLVRTYYERLQAGDFGAYAEFIHPDEARRFKDMLIEVFRMADREGDTRLIAMTFGPEASLTDVEEAAPRDFVGAFMKLAAGMLKDASLSGVEILGSVAEGERVHVVVRSRVGAGPLQVTQMEVVSTQPHRGEPRLMLTGSLEGLGVALARRAAQAPQDSGE